MRGRDLTDNKKDMPETAVIRRMRFRRRLTIETGDSILFDVAAYKLDREIGVAEHIAVERNLTVVRRWPEIIFDDSSGSRYESYERPA
ncbi:MAG: hypothetical protein WBO10_01400 [Pyrinomonadaceae bacterium]